MDRPRDHGNSSPALALGPLEAEVMDLVWEIGKGTVRDLYRVLLTRREIAYTTVMTVMSNLASKGVLKRHRKGRAYIYVPVLSRDDFTRGKMAEIVDSMLNRFTEPAMTYLVERMSEVNPQRLAELEEAITRLRKKNKEISSD